MHEGLLTSALAWLLRACRHNVASLQAQRREQASKLASIKCLAMLCACMTDVSGVAPHLVVMSNRLSVVLAC